MRQGVSRSNAQTGGKVVETRHDVVAADDDDSIALGLEPTAFPVARTIT
jgi:hypothetical protein